MIARKKNMATIEDTNTKSFIIKALDYIDIIQLNIPTPQMEPTSSNKKEIIKVLVCCNFTGQESIDEKGLSYFAGRVCLLLK